jgi:hypothetical protein
MNAKKIATYGCFFLCGMATGFGMSYVFSQIRKKKPDEKVVYTYEQPKKAPEERNLESTNEYEEVLNDIRLDDDIEEALASMEHPEDDDSDDESDSDEGESDEDEDCDIVERAPDELVEPYVISYEDFSIGNPHYDKVTLMYFEDDDTLIGQDYEVIDDPIATVGYNLATKFGDQSLDPDVVYIRNENRGDDYEVIRRHGAYAEEVLGGWME